MAGLKLGPRIAPELQTCWLKYITRLPELNLLQIPRWTGIRTPMELHAFSDASEKTYAAAIYLRGLGPHGDIEVSLLLAKTKITPIKPVSIPRLELCGALLAARLLCRLTKHLKLESCPLYAWTDARVVLAWLRAHPSRWTPFVANRVAAIQELMPGNHWHYVATSENPADLATRGISPSELRDRRLWWSGPPWLGSPSSDWPSESDARQEVTEERRTHATTLTTDKIDNDVLTRFSSFSKLIRVSAYCLRLLRDVERPHAVHLTADELARCRLRWCRIAQHQDFAEEIKVLSRGSQLARRSPLLSLRPFQGQDGLIRVGGRLAHAPLAFAEKPPIVLAKENHLSLLLVRDAHERTLHGGPQLTRSGTTSQQQMGHLPADRVRPARPFWTTGVDYAGPIKLRISKGRGCKGYKGYICLFICMVTRAVHLEAVSDLTSSSFLAAFRRFVARRGRCAYLTSDNGTNFRGAERELRDLFSAAADFYKDCKAQLAQDSTEWAFIPPSAPHFGGLWEAGVKATKYHLRRVLGDQILTYEELTTLLCQIEACLNSRPLYPLSNDPNDYSAITPGHFLIGESPVNVPEPPTLTDTHGRANSRSILITNLRDHFWNRWSREYLHHLQQLGKWRQRSENLQPGALVLIKDDLLPPAKWSLGRISEVHPGDDGIVRVVTVETSTSALRRPITKICPLPIKPADLTANTQESNLIKISKTQTSHGGRRVSDQRLLVSS
ncbi:uncharacterized protein LOC114944557 [Nylanderia fulva]|uniref:uncharacterized protein LOC114944557 n=1 Tax=Nylanderia fulva TaxID=613905 RepID=UPI0010FB19F4|nr:uncharacterized protein LOC114944557 [Nylanderia fulva]